MNDLTTAPITFAKKQTVDLKTDPNRITFDGKTGIFVRAQDPDTNRWGTYDIAQLDKDSLFVWLMSKGEEWSLNTVGILLGHGHLTPNPSGPVTMRNER